MTIEGDMSPPAATSPVTPADRVIAAALASLPDITPSRLVALVRAAPLDDVWRAVCRGRVASLPGVGPTLRRAADSPDLAGSWKDHARRLDLDAIAARLDAGGVTVRVLDRAGYPAVLAGDRQPPGVLLTKGDVAALDRPRVAIVGTRRCTHYGREVAAALGRDLATAGVAVVSGLALGIDGCAHEGALAALAADDAAASPVGVVGSGLDVVYPPAHRTLWRRVAESGLLMTEAPLGARADRWRFPRRNRILAALADVVVVVESHARGGSMLTVQEALDRGVPVMAVPGSVRSPSSAGTNHLLSEGMPPVLDAADVLVALSLEGAMPGPRPPGHLDAGPRAAMQPQPHVEGDEAAVLDAVDWTPTATEDVMRRTGFGFGAVATVLHALERRGLVHQRGAWWERVSS
ncbi:MAG TPA: DNA-protecting protein DprA [Acidimicrobiales bacterium]|nr:DNA-protecting protein DprA [Acidimicrobiales bacterium]